MTRRSVVVGGLGHGGNPVPDACRVGPLLMTGGVRGVDRATGEVPEPLEEEMAAAFSNLGVIMAAGGSQLSDIAHVTVFLAETNFRSALNAAWIAAFPDPGSRPARHVLVHDLPARTRVQLEATAHVKDPS